MKSILILLLAGFGLAGPAAPARAALPERAGDNPHGDLKGMECTLCHSTTAWSPLAEDLDFDHDRDAGFRLEGAHALLACSECHGLEFGGLADACESCHTDVHHGSAGVDCQRCHNQERWTDPGFFRRAHDQSAFPLTGAHARVGCIDCHGGQNFSEAPGQCLGCHQADYLSSRDPAHSEAGFSTDCATCHSAELSGWTATFEHPAAFPLSQGHRGPACNACHTPGQPMNQVERDCAGCHSAAAVPDPDHGSPALQGACDACHTPAAWTGAVFDHDRSLFPLTGLHGTTDCNACHLPEATPRYSGLASECAACHQADADAAADPDHSRPSLAGDCALCHNPAGWTPAEYEHSLSEFPLTGAHVEVSCADCHGSEGGGAVHRVGQGLRRLPPGRGGSAERP